MITPAGYRLLIKADPVETVSKGGIITIASLESEKMERAAQTNGTLVAVGEQAWSGDKPWAKVGDRVSYIRHAGKLISDPSTQEDFLIINDEDVLSIITED